MTDRSLQEFDTEFDDAVANYKQGNVDDALTVFRRLADLHYVDAYTELASHEYSRGNDEGVRPWLAKMEAVAAEGDAVMCFDCYLAYRFGWRQVEFLSRNKIANDYLRRAAELGVPFAQYTLAKEHLSGSNDLIQDERLYLHWIAKAIENRNDDAIYDHVEYLFERGQPVPDDLLAHLSALAREWPNAAKLLAKVKRPRR